MLFENVKLLMLGIKLYLVDLRGNVRYHVAIEPNDGAAVSLHINL